MGIPWMSKAQMKAEDLEDHIRTSLPAGSSLAEVENFLAANHLEYSFQSKSRIVYAVARKLAGSTFVTAKSLSLKFHFDDKLALSSTESQVLYTGP